MLVSGRGKNDLWPEGLKNVPHPVCVPDIRHHHLVIRLYSFVIKLKIQIMQGTFRLMEQVYFFWRELRALPGPLTANTSGSTCDQDDLILKLFTDRCGVQPD